MTDKDDQSIQGQDTKEQPAEELQDETSLQDTAPVKEQRSEADEVEETTKPTSSSQEATPEKQTDGVKTSEKLSSDKPKKQVKKDEKQKDKTQKTEAPSDDFLYIVRIANTDIDGNKRVVYGLTQIKGIGMHLAILVADHAGITRDKKMGDLSEKEIAAISEALEAIPSTVPPWMMNHRKDYDTGEDIHLISTNVDLRLRDDINMLKMIRSYRGIRHESNLPVRGQRTRANGRFGLTMGVSRKTVKGP